MWEEKDFKQLKIEKLTAAEQTSPPKNNALLLANRKTVHRLNFSAVIFFAVFPSQPV